MFTYPGNFPPRASDLLGIFVCPFSPFHGNVHFGASSGSERDGKLCDAAWGVFVGVNFMALMCLVNI